MKFLLKKIVALLMSMMIMVSLVGCSDSMDEVQQINQDVEDDDKDEEESKSKKESEKEQETEGLSKADKQVLEEILECMAPLFMEQGENIDDATAQPINEAVQMLDSVDVSDCSQNVKDILTESKLLMKEQATIFELYQEIEAFSSDLDAILLSDNKIDISELSTMDEIAIAYNTIVDTTEQLENMERPKYFEHMVQGFVEILDSYEMVLLDLYQARENGDYLSEYSDLCFYEELMSELESYLGDLDQMLSELGEHLAVTEERLVGMTEEVLNNIDAVEKGNFSNLRFSYLESDKILTSTISCIDTIYPAMYNGLDAVSILTLSCAQSDYDVLVTVEVEGFSQKYEQTLTLGMVPQRVYVKPPVLSSGLNLDNQKETQIKVSISDVSTGKVLASETNNVKLMSINDFKLNSDEYGYSNCADILAWVTPESAYIQDVLRYAAAYMKDYTGYEGIPGYQYVSSMDELNTTAYQVYAIQKAISDLGVRYVMSSYSIGEAQKYTQRVNRPDETLTSRSGICIETTVLMASALQAAGFDSMIVFTTGHAQVAVETWAGSGEYILIETTLLPVEGPLDMYGQKNYLNTLLDLYTNEEWETYLSNNNGQVYNCNMATNLGITPLIY